MLDVFWLQVGLSFLVGGLYIAASIRAAEKFGTRWGGLLLGLPSTTLVSLYFIGWTQGTDAVATATSLMPLTVAILGVFQLVFFLTQGKGLLTALLAATLAWLALALPLAAYNVQDMAVTLPIGLAVYAAIALYFRQVPNRTAAPQRFSKTEFAIRAVLCGTLIAATVALSKTAGPLWGGVLASFPIAFSSTVLLISAKHGHGFTSSVVKAMQLVSGTIIAFVTLLHFTVLPLGLLPGFLASYAAAVAVGILVTSKTQ